MVNNKILVIDDETVVRDSVRDCLEGERYELIFAENGKEGLQLFFDHNPVLVILDLIMPFMNGVEFLEHIKLSPSGPHTVIVLTAYGKDEDIEKCFNLGVSAFQRKPFNFYELIGLVKHSMELKQAEEKLKEIELEATVFQNIKTISRIGSNIVHRFNNLLTPLSANGDMWSKLVVALSAYLENPDNLKARKTIDFFVAKGVEIIRDERASFSKIKRIIALWKTLSMDKPKREPYPVSLTKCVKAALELVEQELYIGNTINMNFTEDVPPIIGSFTNITRLYINLLQNAIAANKKMSGRKNDFKGSITVSISYDQNYVLSSITDNGIGMDKDTLAQVMEQVSSSKRIFPIPKGGLYDSFGIVNNCGAKILARSDGEGHGSSLVVSFSMANPQNMEKLSANQKSV